jgi:hypothetical protein
MYIYRPSVINRTFNLLASELFFSILLEELSCSAALNSDENKLEASIRLTAGVFYS